MSESQRAQFREAQIAAKATRRVLAPVVVTERYPSFRNGRLEVWQARTRDGQWTITRLEEQGTPWEATYMPSGDIVWYPSLTKARQAVADGTALRMIEQCRSERT